MCMRRCRLYNMTASTPSPDEGRGAMPLPGVRRPKRYARKRQLNEFTPSHSDGSLRDRFGPHWHGKLRSTQLLRSEFLIDSNKGSMVLLRPSLQTLLEGRLAGKPANRTADEYREKASPLPAVHSAGLLLAFSPFIGTAVILSGAKNLKYNGAKKEMMWTSRYSCTEPARLVETSDQGGHTGCVRLGIVKRRQCDETNL